jgi:hypothetical protein
MSDAELHDRIRKLVREVTGPMEEFERFEDFAEAFFANIGFGPDEWHGGQEVLRGYWEGSKAP